MASPLPPDDNDDIDDDDVIKDSPQPEQQEANEEEEPEQQQQQQQQQQQRKAVLAPPPLPLDWTRLNECNNNNNINNSNNNNIIRYPWDVADMSTATTDTTNLTIVGTSGQKITRMGSTLHQHVSPNLTHLILRSHLIRTMEGIRHLDQLELLELYDNMIDELRELDVVVDDDVHHHHHSISSSIVGDDKIVPAVTGEENVVVGETEVVLPLLPRTKLRVLDISYNVIRDMGPIALCPNLQELYIAQNKIKCIKGLKQLKHLRKMDLGANRIRSIDEEEMSGLVNLEELWLGKNKIEHIRGLSKLTKLRKLDLQSNRLTRIENLCGQVDTLEELYLSHNAIDVVGAMCETGLALPFVQLSTIDMTRNRLTDTSPFAHLTSSLTDLWISGNDIKTFEDIEPLRGLTQLDSLYLEMNPVDKDFEYRMKLAKMIPSLTQIDANTIGGRMMGGGHGYSLPTQPSLAERMRRMQDLAIKKAKLLEGQNEANGEENGHAKSEE